MAEAPGFIIVVVLGVAHLAGFFLAKSKYRTGIVLSVFATILAGVVSFLTFLAWSVI